MPGDVSALTIDLYGDEGGTGGDGGGAGGLGAHVHATISVSSGNTLFVNTTAAAPPAAAAAKSDSQDPR